MLESVRVFAPATIANVGCGYDILGFPVEEYGDTLTITSRQDDQLVVKSIVGAEGIPLEPDKNVATVAISAMLEALGEPHGFDISIAKNIPPGSGLGSSASSSAAAVFGANALLQYPFSTSELIPFAMKGEEVASLKAHADNVAPSLLGGFAVVRSYDPLDVFTIPSPVELRAAVIYPHLEVKTSDAKKILKNQVKLSDAVVQWGNVAGLISGLFLQDYPLIGRSMEDIIVEPVRRILIPHYEDMKAAAMDHGALGYSISGSGPSMFALTEKGEIAQEIVNTIGGMLNSWGIPHTSFVSGINSKGARLI